jgi:hypothetical protein
MPGFCFLFVLLSGEDVCFFLLSALPRHLISSVFLHIFLGRVRGAFYRWTRRVRGGL